MNVPEWIAGCMEVERKMAELYSLFADKFGSEADLFSTLREEEMGHIRSLSLVEPADDESGTKDLGQEARLLLRTLDAVDRAITRTRFSTMGLEEALGTALTLEEGVVENFVNTIPSLGESNREERLNEMSTDSSRHADMLRKALIRNGFMHYS